MMSKSQMGASSSTQATNPQEEINQKLRDKLVEQEARAERNYEEMREYKSWLRQIEEGQDSIKGADENMGKFEPVPDNPPGIWDQHDGSVVGKASGDGQNEWITRISRREHEIVVVKPWPRCQDLDVWRSGTVHAVCVASGDPDQRA
jgi:hypothetical protein